MQPPNRQKIPKKKIRIDCGGFLIRTLTVDDASDRWANWMDDPKNLRLVNATPQHMTKSDIVTYIKQFDQRSHLLLGIVDKKNGTLVGTFRIDIDYALNRCLVFLIGEPKYRHWFLMTDIKVPFYDLIFETLDLKMMLATVLASNRALIGFLLRLGWSLDKTIERHVKSQTDDSMLDLCFFSYSRDAWRAWKAENLPQRAGSS
jgi:RimJ/RimL family protein N-acetyltransferase